MKLNFPDKRRTAALLTIIGALLLIRGLPATDIFLKSKFRTAQRIQQAEQFYRQLIEMKDAPGGMEHALTSKPPTLPQFLSECQRLVQSQGIALKEFHPLQQTGSNIGIHLTLEGTLDSLLEFFGQVEGDAAFPCRVQGLQLEASAEDPSLLNARIELMAIN